MNCQYNAGIICLESVSRSALYLYSQQSVNYNNMIFQQFRIQKRWYRKIYKNITFFQ